MAEPAWKKRRVRKGTRSCWECRKRKVKCRFNNPDDDVCINCVDRDTVCVSQEASADPGSLLPADDTAPAIPEALSSAGTEPLAQRLDRLEGLMQKLAGSGSQGTPPGDTASVFSVCGHPDTSGSGDCHAPSSQRYGLQPTVDLLDSSAVANARDIAATISCGSTESTAPYEHIFARESPAPSASASASASTASVPHISPPSTVSITSPPEAYINNSYLAAYFDNRRKHHRQTASELHALLPPPQVRRILAQESPGAAMILTYFHSHDDQVNGKTEPQWSLASAEWPTLETHPVLIAKRLLQYTICMQHLPPNYSGSGLIFPVNQQPCERMGTWVGAVTSLVTGDDDLVGCIEGIETLMLLSMFLSDAGHLRKAWSATRRALSLAQLMGMHRPVPPRLRSCAAAGDPKVVASAPVLWYRISFWDSYHSLILGLPLGSRDAKLSGFDLVAPDSSIEKLGREHFVLARKIADRNEDTPGSSEAYAATQIIDGEFEKAAQKISTAWWDIPDMVGAMQETTALPTSVSRLMWARAILHLQVRHFTLLIFLHLPYLLRDRETRRYEHNRFVCMRASRAVLKRFLVYREGNTVHAAGREVDYSSLMAAMTLLLGHLGREFTSVERQMDRSLVEKVLLTFRELGALKRDRLAVESADTITQLLPIIASTDGPRHNVKLKVPFLGTVNIEPKPPAIDTAGLQSSRTNEFLEETLLDECELDPSFSLSLDTAMMPSQGQRFEGMNDDTWPFITPETDDWTFQGIDTTYWSTLHQGST